MGAFAFENLIIEDAGALHLENMNLSVDNIRIGTDTELTPDAPQLPSHVYVDHRSFMFAKTMEIWGNGTISGRGRGFGPGKGPGAGAGNKGASHAACGGPPDNNACLEYGSGYEPGSGG